MINLLPPLEKKVLRLSQTKNLIVVLCSVFIISLVCFIFILLSIKYYILSDVNSQKILLQDFEKEYQSSDLEGFKNEIKKYNEILPVVQTFYKKEIYYSDILILISEIQKPEGVYLNAISMGAVASDGKIKAGVSGVSDSRENLLLFQKNLQQEEKIKNIYFSPESWINPVNANFSFIFEY